MYTASIIAAIFAMVLGVPAVVWLTKLIRPPKPEDEAIERRVEEARRRPRQDALLTSAEVAERGRTS
jgi:hypothetical protein